MDEGVSRGVIRQCDRHKGVLSQWGIVTEGRTRLWDSTAEDGVLSWCRLCGCVAVPSSRWQPRGRGRGGQRVSSRAGCGWQSE